ncbi:MAG: V-type ATPase 116kDa subunit family protein, partial [Angelakisella sp.]
MSIEKMSMVSLRGERAYLDEALLSCTNSGYFHPELASSLSEYANTLTTLKEENPYTAIMKQLEELAHSVDITLHYTKYEDLQLQAKDFAGYVAELSGKLGKLLQRRNGVTQLIESHKRTLNHLTHLRKLEQNFDDIFQSKYLEVRFGRLPVDSYEKLSFYQDKPYVFFSYDNDGSYHWCLYLCAASDKQEIDGLFSSLYFERIRIPDYAHGTPTQSIAFIDKDLNREQAELASLNSQIAAVLNEQRTTLEMLYTKSKVLAEAFDLRRYAGYVKNDFVVIGFVPKSREQDFAARLAALAGHVELSLRPGDADQRIAVPVRLKNNWLLRPFEMFVDIYGLPSYKDIDPTPFLGLTYILLFGIMFGDLGQGLLIMLLGLFLEQKKKMALGGVMARIGVSSMVFGFFYGSVFGFEELLIPVHRALFGVDHLIQVMAPASTNTILMGAIALGVVIIMASILMNIFLGLRKKEIDRAVFSNNGIAGLVFYGAVIYAAVSTLLLGQSVLTPWYIALFIALPLVVIFLKEPLGHLLHKKKPFPDGIGGFVLESFFEMFEVLLSFVSNTMSFLRVGGFILSHAGMMAVVMTLSGMVGAGASPVVIVIGNLFVMALEGLIVGIQVLRLEFYEIFSRFYDGDGKPFT